MNSWSGISGSMINISSSYDQIYLAQEENDLWERMYVHPKPVIIVCGYCKCHNAISNPTCIQCGAPMGYGKQRDY